MLVILTLVLFFLWLGNPELEEMNGGLRSGDWYWLIPLSFIFDTGTIVLYEILRSL